MRHQIADLETIGWLRSQLEELKAWRDQAARGHPSNDARVLSLERHYQWLRAEIENLLLSSGRAA